MAKILDLRNKTTKTFQKPKEAASQSEASLVPKEREVGVERTITSTVKQPEPVATHDKTEENPRISWEAPSFHYNPQKGYLSLLIVALLTGAVALLIFKGDTLTSIFLILSSLVLFLYGNQKPIISKIKIDQSGILVDDRMYYYKDLKSFWIDYNPGGLRELSMESTKWYMPYIKVLLNEQNPIEVRSLVINFLPEQEHENSLADYIGRKLGL